MNIKFSNLRRYFLALSIVLPFVLGALPSAAAEFEGNDISGHNLGQNWEMVDTDGNTRSATDFKGKVSLIFFGYTQCPDVCPTAMAQAAQAIELLGDKAKDVQVIMISVDPERDTPEVLKQYVQAFNPNFIGLTGSATQLEQTAKSFKAFYSKEASSSPGHYAMNHTSAFYLMDKEGQARALLGPTLTPEEMVHDIELLL